MIGDAEVTTDERIESRNPAAHDEIIGLACSATAEDADAAVRAAHAALRDWAGRPVAEVPERSLRRSLSNSGNVNSMGSCCAAMALTK